MSSAAKGTGTKIAAISVGKVVGKIAANKGAGPIAAKALGSGAGFIVTPVVWAATGHNPDAGDVTGWLATAGGGLAGGAWFLPGMAVGAWKGYVDDVVAEGVEKVKADEPSHARAGIKPVGAYGFFASDNIIQAANIAADGGVVWKSHGVWVYITDGTGALIADYRPGKFDEGYQPALPLVSDSRGRFNTQSIR